jgi:superoxide oxidase
MGNADDRTVAFFGLPLPRLIGPDKALGELLEEVYEVVANAGYFPIGLHSAAGLFHHYVQGDTTLARMLPGATRPVGRAHYV